MKKILAVLATVLIGLGALLLISAPSWAAEDDTVAIDKFDTTFVYQGDNAWTVITHAPNAAIHNIGSQQAWLCNENFVGEGIEACVPERAYGTTGEILGDRSCVYIQGDSPAWDTVPGTEKEVCAPLNPPIPSPSPSPSETVLPTDTPAPSESPAPTTAPSPSLTAPTPAETIAPALSAPKSELTELARSGVAHDAQAYIWTLTYGALAVALGILLLALPAIIRSRRQQ